MKILIYQPRASYFTGGGEVYPLQNAIFFSKLGHDVSLLTTKAEFLNESDYFKIFTKENPKIKIVYLNLDEKFKSIYKKDPGIDWERWDEESLYVSRLAYQYIDKNDFDIIAIHNVIDCLAVPFGKKHVLHLHGDPSELNYVCNLVLKHEDNLIAVSENVAKKWENLGCKKGIPICTNAINQEIFIESNKTRKLDLLFVGRLIPIKGVQTILEALKILKEEYSLEPKFRIIGQGPYYEELVKLTKEFELNSQVEFCGLVSQKKLIESYQSAKLAVLPSFDKEGIMSTLLEAASCHTPSITTKGTSMEEFAQDNKNALLVEPQNARDLAKKINYLMLNESVRKKIAENANKEIKENYTWSNKAKQLIEMYNSII